MKTLQKLFVLLSTIFLASIASAQNQVLPVGFSVVSTDENGLLFEARFAHLQNESENFVCLVALPQGCDSVVIDVKKIDFGLSYVSSNLLSKQFIQNSTIQFIRGYRILHIDFNPFFRFLSKKNHITGLLVRVDFVKNKTIQEENRLYSEAWGELVKTLVINPMDVPNYQNPLPVKEEDGAEYLIIAPDEFLPALDPLKTFRIRQGISTKLVGTSVTGQSSVSIKNYINEAYNTWTVPPSSILLAADHPLIPAPVWNSYCSSDNMYADVDDDNLPNIFISRIPVNSVSMLDNFVQRIISFESNPITNPDYYQYPLACTGFENPSATNWMLAEIFNGWYEQKMLKSPERQYTGTIPAPDTWPDLELFQYFGPGGLGYIAETPAYLANYTGGTAAGINQAINQGAMTFFSFSTGSTTAFTSPPYSSSDLNGLTTAPPTLFVTINSLNGNFSNQSTDCLAEGFLKTAQGGIGVIAASETIYSSGANWFTIGLIDGLWDDFYPDSPNQFQTHFIVPCQANVYAKYFLHINNFPINPQIKQTFYHLFHYFGEPYTSLHDTIPSVIQVDHPEQFLVGQEIIEITADSGSTVALVLNHQLCCVQQSNGNPMLLPLTFAQPGDTLHITATQKNRFRYYNFIFCHPGVGINPPETGFTFSIFPNPTNNFIKITFSEKLKNGKIELINSAGFISFGSDFHNCSDFIIPVTNLDVGLYFVKISDKNLGSLIKKIVIQ